MTRKHRHRPSPPSPEFSISSSPAASTSGNNNNNHPRRSILRDKKTDDGDDDYSDTSASQSLYDESQADEYEKHDDIESISDPSSSQKPTSQSHIPNQTNQIQPKPSSISPSNFLNLSQPTTPYIKIAPLPIFRGTPTECPITHMSRFTKACRANGASSSIDMMTRIFPVTLQEEALLWYDLNIEPYPNLSWDDIKSSFLQAYHRIELAEELRSELMRMNQGENESVRSYFLRLQWVLEKWPDHGLCEALLKGLFIDGLRTEFHEWILLQKPSSLNDALRLAFSYEQMRSIRMGKKGKVVEKCGFCEGSHEERECEVKEGMKVLWKQSKEKQGNEEEVKEFVRSKSMGGRRSVHDGKVEEGDGENEVKTNQCKCIKHQCSMKKLMRNEKEGAIVKKGHDDGIKMAVSLLQEFQLPEGLLPLADVIEVGFVKNTGYMWISQKKKVEHQFKMISKLVSYDTEITGYVSKKKIKKLKGVKAKELMLWPPVSEISVDESSNGKIHFKSLAGITKTFPVDAFAAGQ
ncbi:putative retrotransposon gag domain-containing protein [Senna tora]|uniref:Putative retrotransposon gag domain-containing protein n=1 Tax=Senna tora TaxID=362788 RepID=A0A834TIV4_9FABA|nr:putative retrotransposon gag domain-containing protein [Senna tora]